MKKNKKILLILLVGLFALLPFYRIEAAANWWWNINGQNLVGKSASNSNNTAIISVTGDTTWCGCSAGCQGSCSAEEILTLNNYNGGRIMFGAAATAPKQKIKLVGDNYINISNGVGLALATDVEFIGDGTLTITAQIPIAIMSYTGFLSENEILFENQTKNFKPITIKIDLSNKEVTKEKLESEDEKVENEQKEVESKESKNDKKELVSNNTNNITIAFVVYLLISLIAFVILILKLKKKKSNE